MTSPLRHQRRRSSLLGPSNTTVTSPGGGPTQDDAKPAAAADKRDRRHRGGRHGGGGGGRSRGDVDDGPLVSDEDLHDDEETGLTGRQRLRKRERRRRNARLDQRIVRDRDVVVTDAEKKEADQNVVRRLLINAALIGLWYLFSLSISIYNKWMFDSKQLDFRFPMFVTSVHMLIQFSLACLILYLFPSMRPYNGPHHRSDMGQSRHEAGPMERTVMTKMFYLTRIGPCGAATGLDIGLGNASLKFITLTFYTMCKSSALAFVLLFAFVFKLEKPTWRLVAIIATMTIGVVMMVAGEVKFDLVGFVLIISAAFFSGFRWGLTQILLLRNPATSNPFSSIFFLAPVMFATLFSIALFAEGLPELFDGLARLVDDRGPVVTPLILLFPGTLAFLMTASEFALLQRTSVVTLSIAGIFKEVVTISAASLVFGDKLTPINASGLFVTIGAICAYNYIKITKMREEARVSAHAAHQSVDLAPGGSAAESGSAGRHSGSSGSSSDGENDADVDAAEDAALLRREQAADAPQPETSPVLPGSGGPRLGDRLRDA